LEDELLDELLFPLAEPLLAVLPEPLPVLAQPATNVATKPKTRLLDQTVFIAISLSFAKSS
jgi:hypothetical protein